MPEIIPTKKEFDEIINDKENNVVVVDFFAEWCGPCKMIAPFYEQLAKDHPKIKFIKVNVDDNEEVAVEYGIQAMPTFIIIQGGKEIKADRIQGASKAGLEQLVKKHEK